MNNEKRKEIAGTDYEIEIGGTYDSERIKMFKDYGTVFLNGNTLSINNHEGRCVFENFFETNAQAAKAFAVQIVIASDPDHLAARVTGKELKIGKPEPEAYHAVT